MFNRLLTALANTILLTLRSSLLSNILQIWRNKQQTTPMVMQKTLKEYNTYTITEGPLKVAKIQVMHGANYFSAGPIVLIRLNLGEYNEIFTNKIPNFPEKLQTAMPSLYQHHCSVGKEGGFLLRVNERNIAWSCAGTCSH